MIVNAPSGSTTAELCNCTSTAGPNSPLNSGGSTNTDINSTVNNSINNNLTLNSLSGNALVTDNTTAGNATSGNASAAANILNLSNSSFALTNWFGVLFINVFGSWIGSFGINTAAGNPPASDTSGTTSGGNSALVKAVKVFGFVPGGGNSNQNFGVVQLASATNPTNNSDNQHGTVLAAVNNSTPPKHQTGNRNSLFWTAGSLFLLAGVLSAEEAVARRKEARMKFRKYIHSITVEPLKKY
jgi:hypothetical protein